MIDYLYDGSFDGYLTAIFYAYGEKDEVAIYKEANYSPSLLATSKFIPVEQDKVERVYNSVLKKLSYDTLDNLYRLHLSSETTADSLGLSYLRLCYRYGDSINLAKNNDVIRTVDLINKRIWTEVHRYYGFVRFKEISPMVFYAAIEPDHNILPLIMGHFKRRFSDQYFIIHDLKRHSAIVYDTKTIRIQYLSTEESRNLEKSNIKDPFEMYFKTYYTATTIKERLNSRQQNAYMPKRYYKHLVEL